ncbi:MAG: hypothetical protein PF484_02225 [Bacteroidales bacterium]|jgi:tetratricopeptide (TPR) repeat protein|nr:hypothetical protein [Bacteroidales bacterium]
MRNFHKIILSIFTLIFALSISVSNAQEYNNCPVYYKVTPNVLVEKGGVVAYEVTVTFPERYLNRRAAFDVKPVLKYGAAELALPIETFIGEKVEGVTGQVVPYVAGGTYTFSGEFDFVPEMATSIMVVNPPHVYVPNMCNVIDFKNCYDPQFKVATGITQTKVFVGEPILAESGYVQETIATKAATLYFPVNIFRFNKEFSLNKSTEAVAKRTALNNFLAQGWEIKNIEIDGYASPEGFNAFNTTLSQKRAKTAEQYIRSEMQNMNIKDINAIPFNFNTVIPDWDGFIAEVEASDISEKSSIISALNSTNRESEIKPLISKYPKLRSFLPQLRRAKIAATCFEPKHSDKELVALATNKPEELTCQELLHAATLTENNSAIYESAADLFPKSWKTLSNFAYSEIKNGNYRNAIFYLEKALKLSPENAIVKKNLEVAIGEKKNAGKS